MTTLVCCLVGFDKLGVQIVRNLAILIRPTLTFEWKTRTDRQCESDLLLCDIDGPQGNEAWREALSRGERCAVATAADEPPGGLVIRKPLRAHGPNGLVNLFNQAAAEIVRKNGVSCAVRDVPVLEDILMLDDFLVLEDAEASANGPAAASHHADHLTPLPPALEPGAAAGPLFQTHEEESVLAVLQRLRAASHMALLYFDAIPPICVVPEIGVFYSRASLSAISDMLLVEAHPASVSIVASAHLGRVEAEAEHQNVPPRPLTHLFWVAALRCSGTQDVARYEADVFRMRSWPDFAILPYDRHHMQWCGLLARQPHALGALAARTGHTLAAAAAFLKACDELGILERSSAAKEAADDIEAPVAGRVFERARVFRSFLNLLGIKRF